MVNDAHKKATIMIMALEKGMFNATFLMHKAQL